MQSSNANTDNHTSSHFLRGIIERDLASGKHDRPGLPKVITRFPPEPNGYLHIGHAKSICLNFGLAKEYQGRCHLRFDDTNPTKEEQEYVDAIIDNVRWLGFNWEHQNHEYCFYASDYFEKMYQMAEYLIQAGHAYVDSQSAEDIRKTRGTLTEPGKNSPYRERAATESLELFRQMRSGAFAEGTHVLRTKIDMGSPNMNMRDPAIYRIRHAEHHRTGNDWCIYPMYDYAHPISDALENITHSICTLEFQDHRPFYDWLLERLAEGGFFKKPLPHQYEFARLNLSYTVTSKRKLLQLVTEGIVSGWDDPRMPTIAGLRRRGYTPSAIRLFCERIGVSKADSWIEFDVLEGALRDDLDTQAPRATAVIKPLKLIIDNFSEQEKVACSAPIFPAGHALHDPSQMRHFLFTKELWIDEDDFQENPEKGFFRLFPGNRVRLRHGFVVECKGIDKDEHGKIIAIHCNYFADSKSGTDGANQYKVKGNIHWLSAQDAVPAQIYLYDRLFNHPYPDAGDEDFKNYLNPLSKQVVSGFVEPNLITAQCGQIFQFERQGYFVLDQASQNFAENPSQKRALIFNKTVGLKDSWGAKK